MASFDFLVDTSPMASAMSGVSTHVTETTVAVAAMQAAVIAEEKAAADRLCADIDNGFFCLMQSQLSMKKTEHFSNLQTKFMSLRELGKDLCSKQDRMELDVARIRREYYKLFHSIDKSMEKQMRELDTETYRVVEQRERLITSRQLKDITEMLCYAKDTSSVVGTALSAKMKKRTRRTLERIGGNVSQNQDYRDQMQNMLSATPVSAPTKEYIPVVYAQEESMVMPGVQVTEVRLPDGLDKSVENTLSVAVSGRLSELSGLSTSPAEQARIRAEFLYLLNQSGLESRVAGTVRELFEGGGRR